MGAGAPCRGSAPARGDAVCIQVESFSQFTTTTSERHRPLPSDRRSRQRDRAFGLLIPAFCGSGGVCAGFVPGCCGGYNERRSRLRGGNLTRTQDWIVLTQPRGWQDRAGRRSPPYTCSEAVGSCAAALPLSPPPRSPLPIATPHLCVVIAGLGPLAGCGRGQLCRLVTEGDPRGEAGGRVTRKLLKHREPWPQLHQTTCSPVESCPCTSACPEVRLT